MTSEAFASLLRVVGASHVALALGHVLLWRAFRWRAELERLSPLTRRVFVAHLAVVAFVLSALGALAAARPELLLAPSELARLLLAAATVFWLARFAAQPIFFDPVLLPGSPRRAYVRAAASLLFGGYVVVYGWALARVWP